MKRLLAICLALALVACCIVTASAETTVTALGDDYLNVPFSNEYRGFCVDYGKDQAYIGDTFVVKPTSAALNNNDGADVSMYLKAMLVECFHTMFEKLDDGHYAITENTRQIAQRTAWHFTDGYQDHWDDIGPVVEQVKTAVANGLTIPDSGYAIQVDQTTEITFNFALMETQKDGQQSFFAYKIQERTWELPPQDNENTGDDDNNQTNNPPVPPVEEETPTDTPTEPEQPVETPTDTPDEPVVTPTEPEDPVVTPTEPEDEKDDPEDNQGGQMGEDEDGKNPPVNPDPEGPADREDPKEEQPKEEQPKEEQPKEEIEEEPVVTPTENPKTADSSPFGAALFTLGVAATALLVLKKRK